MDPSSTYRGYREKSLLKRWNLIIILLGIIDFLSILVAFQLAYLFNSDTEGLFFKDNSLSGLLLGILPFWLLLLYLIKFTQIPTKRYKVLFFIYVHAGLVILSILFLYSYFFNLDQISRIELVQIPFLGFMFLFFIRLIEYFIFRNTGSRRHIHKNIVIIADDLSLPVIEGLLTKKGSGYKVDVIFTDSELVKKKFETTTILLSENYLGILHDLIEVDLIDELFFLKDKTNPTEVREIITLCEELGVTFRLKEKEAGANLTTGVRTSISENKFLSFINIADNTIALAIRKTLDINLAILMIVMLSPVYIITGVLVKLSSKGPVVTKQPKVGGMGRLINLYKFRTVSPSASQSKNITGINNEIDTIEAINSEYGEETRIGKFLTGSGLDQLPMLFNVLKGDISIIGPNHPLQSYKERA